MIYEPPVIEGYAVADTVFYAFNEDAPMKYVGFALTEYSHPSGGMLLISCTRTGVTLRWPWAGSRWTKDSMERRSNAHDFFGAVLLLAGTLRWDDRSDGGLKRLIEIFESQNAGGSLAFPNAGGKTP